MLFSLAGRYDNSIPTRFLAPLRLFKKHWSYVGEEPCDGGRFAGGPEAGRVALQAYQTQPRPGAGPRIQAMLDSKNFFFSFFTGNKHRRDEENKEIFNTKSCSLR